MRATATFEINVWDATAYDESAGGPLLSRVTVRKTFQGDIVGHSTAELLMSQASADAAGYVGLERITGRVGDRSGTFDVLHCATQGGVHDQAIWLVAPDSGTGELRGISGTVTYQHDEQGATFMLDYELAAGRENTGG